MILGADGKPYKSMVKPDRRELAPIRIQDKYSSYPSNNLTPVKIARIFRESDQGDIYRLMELFEELEGKDTHLFSQMQTRKNAVMGLDWEIMAGGKEDEDNKIAEFVADVLNNNLDMEDVFLDLQDALGKGFSVMEILWNIENGKAYPKLVWREPKKFRFGEYQELRLLNEDDEINGIELPTNKFIVHRYRARSGKPNRAGIMWVVTWMTLFKNYTIKDWLSFSEVYGMPIRIGKYDTASSEEDKAALMRAILSIGSDAAGVISKNTEIEFIEAVKSEGDLYNNLAAFCNAEISKAVLGQTLTTEVGVGGGSRALGETQNAVRRDLMVSDAKSLAKTIGRDLIVPLVLFNFGPGKKAPWIKFATEEQADQTAEANKYKMLIVDMGVPVSTEHIYEKFGIPKPKEGEELVTPAAISQIPFKSDIDLIANSNTPKKPQAVIDEFVGSLITVGVDANKKDMAEILEIVQKSKDISTIRSSILAKFKNVNKKILEELLAKLMYISNIYGCAVADGNRIEIPSDLALLDFAEAEAYFKQKLPMLAVDYKKLADDAKTRAFTVAKVTKLEYVQSIFDVLSKTIAEGKTLNEFKKDVLEALINNGWEGKLPNHIDLVFRQNVQTAYQVGRFEQMSTDAAIKARPYWMYDAVNDERTRAIHKMMDGQVRRYDDPFWDVWYPPNGFGCRCGVVAVTDTQVKQRNIKIYEGLPRATVDIATGEVAHWLPDKGFASNPAKESYNPDLSKFDPDLKNAFNDK
ncbi:MAG: DUF935 family protein [Acidaminococcaceae bacterium]